jgi:hypothetical protein
VPLGRRGGRPRRGAAGEVVRVGEPSLQAARERRPSGEAAAASPQQAGHGGSGGRRVARG